MADEIDDANRIADIYHQAALKKVSRRQTNRPHRRMQTGKCSSCPDPIEPERLAANPSTETCLFCAEEAEELLKRQRRVGTG